MSFSEVIKSLYKITVGITVLHVCDYLPNKPRK
jgi:hypothetical protein